MCGRCLYVFHTFVYECDFSGLKVFWVTWSNDAERNGISGRGCVFQLSFARVDENSLKGLVLEVVRDFEGIVFNNLYSALAAFGKQSSETEKDKSWFA